MLITVLIFKQVLYCKLPSLQMKQPIKNSHLARFWWGALESICKDTEFLYHRVFWLARRARPFFGDCWASNMSWLMVLHAMAKIFGTNIQDSYASLLVWWRRSAWKDDPCWPFVSASNCFYLVTKSSIHNYHNLKLCSMYSSKIFSPLKSEAQAGNLS
jgi:hypothetical protein